MLKFRLTELYEHVDYFVLVEGTRTFAGNNKPSFFKENEDMFSEFNDKIIYVCDDSMPYSGYKKSTNKDSSFYHETWSREVHQRQSIDLGLQQLSDQLSDSDVIIISDCDEIPSESVINACKQCIENDNFPSILHFHQEWYFGDLTYVQKKNDTDWRLAKAVTYKDYVNTYNRDCEGIRGIRDYTQGTVFPQGGWHFSYFGGPEIISNKLQNFSHQEYNKPENLDPETIKSRMENMEPTEWFSPDGWKRIPVDKNLNLPKNYKMLL